VKKITLVIVFLMSVGVSALYAQGAICDPAVNYLVQGNEFYAQGQYNEALGAYECAIQLDSNNAAAYNGRGNVKRQLQDYAQAIVDYNKAIELDSSIAIFYNNRGWSYYNLGNLDLALDDFNEAITLDDQLAYAYNNRGLVYVARGNYQQALSDYDRAIELGHDPINWPSFNRENIASLTVSPVTPMPTLAPSIQPVANSASFLAEGQAAYRQEDYTKAVELFTSAIELDPNNYYPYCERAAAYYSMGDYENAIADYSAALERAKLAFHFVWRGNSYYAIGDYDSALNDYNSAVETDPNFFSAYLYRSRLQHILGDSDSAFEDAQVWLNQPRNQIIETVSEETDTLDVQIAPGIINRIPFQGEAQQIVNIDTTTDSTSNLAIDPLVILADENNVPLTLDDDSGSGLNAQIKDFVLPSDGEYVLLITGTDGSAFGAVQVQLELK
jgi:tetratricopeptide (TPR) repeat protein